MKYDIREVVKDLEELRDSSIVCGGEVSSRRKQDICNSAITLLGIYSVAVNINKEERERLCQVITHISKGGASCWHCGGRLCWDSDTDFESEDIEGEGVVSYLHCLDCGAEIRYQVEGEKDGD